MKPSNLLIALIITLGAVVSAGSPACAGAYVYAGKRKHVNCGVLLVTTVNEITGERHIANQDAVDQVGNLFFVLDSRTDLKPSGWTLDNPLAPGSASTGLGKGNPAYWEVNLASASDLSRMHVLYLPAKGNVDLDDHDREKLRRFVDGGGVLWIDNADANSPLDFGTTFFIQDFSFDKGVNGQEIAASEHHPLLTVPHWLVGEVGALGANRNMYCNPGYDATDLFRDRSDQPVSFDALLPVVEHREGVGTNPTPSVAANNYGSGRIVATANYVGRACFLDYPFDLPNLKFAYNVLAYASSHSTLRKDPRHSGYSLDTVGGTKLIEQWNLEGVGPIDGDTSPVIYKNVVFYTGVLDTGEPQPVSTLFALDMFPDKDLDHDYEPNDGYRPIPADQVQEPEGVDIIWYFQDPGQTLSSPTVVTMLDPTAGWDLAGDKLRPVDVVLVTSGAGKVYMLEAFPNTGGILSDNPTPPFVTPPYELGTTIDKPTPPLCINGWIYACGGDGRLYAYNPSLHAWAAANNNTTAADEWQVPSEVVDWGVELKAGPSFGFVKSETSGGIVGVVYMLEAFPNTGGVLSPAATPPFVVPPYDLGTTIDKPTPPLCINGWVYACGGDGRLYAYNPSLHAWADANNTTAADEWQVPSKVGVQWGVELRAGPSFGFVKSETSGGIVGVVYWFGSALASASATSSELNDHVYGVPVYAANDRLKVRRSSKDRLLSECRITYREGSISENPEPKVWLKFSGASPAVTEIWPNCGLVGDVVDKVTHRPGSIVIRTGGAIPPDAVIYATYALDYASPVVVQPRIRVPLEPRSNAANQVPATSIDAAPALGPDNMMFVTGTRESGGGSVYGIHNDGNSQSTRWHYYLHSGDDATGVPAVVVDPTNGPMRNPQPYSSPVYAGDKVFVTVTGDGGGPPRGALLCLKANSDFVIRITESAGYGEGGKLNRRPKELFSATTSRRISVKIWQPDLMMGGAGAIVVQPVMAARPVPREMIDYNKGTITFNSFDRPKLSGTGTGMETNTFSPSLPVWVFLDNVEVAVDFSTWGPSKVQAQAAGVPIEPVHGDAVDLSGWNNLLWYYVVPDCAGIHSSPVVIGDTVYFITDDGELYALNTETGETLGGPTDEKPIWQHLVSACMLPVESRVSVSGANGVLLVPAADGLHAFANPTTLVADSNRVVELDGAGEIAWSVDSISWPVSVPPEPLYRSGPVNKPARVKYIHAGDLLVVNSGSNQVCRIDKGGRVGLEKFPSGPTISPTDKFIRWIFEKFCDPDNLLRPGQPTRLLGPTDAILWQEQEPGGAVTVHCLIADSGNHRVLDLVYQSQNGELSPRCQQDATSGYYLPYLNWVTRTDSMNQRYIYDCIQIVPSDNGEQVWAAVSNYATGTDLVPGASGAEDKGLGGAIVALDYRTGGAGGPWLYHDSLTSGQIVARCDKVGNVPLANPRFFQILDKPGGRFMFVCDNHGVYEAEVTTGGAVPTGKELLDLPEVEGYPNYRTMSRKIIGPDGNVADSFDIRAPLLATSVQELSNGNWLIANGYSGPVEIGIDPMTGKKIYQNFGGEVFQYDPVEGTIVWSSPTLVTDGTTLPDGTIVWKQSLENSYILQQPRSAFRQQ